jgi:hypothetical protein
MQSTRPPLLNLSYHNVSSYYYMAGCRGLYAPLVSPLHRLFSQFGPVQHIDAHVMQQVCTHTHTYISYAILFS